MRIWVAQLKKKELYKMTQNYSPYRGEFTAEGGVEFSKFHLNFVRERELPNKFGGEERPRAWSKTCWNTGGGQTALKMKWFSKCNFANEFFQNSNDHVHGRNLKFNRIRMNLDRVKWNSIDMESHMKFQNAINWNSGAHLNQWISSEYQKFRMHIWNKVWIQSALDGLVKA